MSAYQQVRIKTLGETPEGAALFRIFAPPQGKATGNVRHGTEKSRKREKNERKERWRISVKGV